MVRHTLRHTILRYLNFCPDLFGHVGKQLDNKAKFDFNMYDVINWKINNYNTHIVHIGTGIQFDYK